MPAFYRYERLAHDDYRPERIPERPRIYGGCVSPLRDPETLERAKSLLTETRMTATRVATEIGYSGLCPFSAAFELATGQRPSVFRAAQKAAASAQP